MENIPFRKAAKVVSITDFIITFIQITALIVATVAWKKAELDFEINELKSKHEKNNNEEVNLNVNEFDSSFENLGFDQNISSTDFEWKLRNGRANSGFGEFESSYGQQQHTAEVKEVISTVTTFVNLVLLGVWLVLVPISILRVAAGVKLYLGTLPNACTDHSLLRAIYWRFSTITVIIVWIFIGLIIYAFADLGRPHVVLLVFIIMDLIRITIVSKFITNLLFVPFNDFKEEEDSK